MSLATRQLVASRLLLRNDIQRNDILHVVNTDLIEALDFLVGHGLFVEVTALFSDHHNDCPLGTPPDYFGTHAGKYAVDFWLNRSFKHGDYYDITEPEFQHGLSICGLVPHLWQVGLGGSADTFEDRIAAGKTVFSDNGEDHLHLGVS